MRIGRGSAAPIFALCLLVACDAGQTPERYELGIPCAVGEVLDETLTCVPSACDAGRWGPIDPAEVEVFVDQAAAPEGDGSPERPFPTIQQGLDAAGAAGGGVVAVAAGTYHEVLDLDGGHGDVHLAGRCAHLVTIDGSEGQGDEPAVMVAAGFGPHRYDISGVTVTGGRFAGLYIDSGELAIRDSRFVANELSAVAAYSPHARVLLERVELVDTESTLAGLAGRGIDAEWGALVEARDCLLSDNAETAVLSAYPGAMVSLERVRIVDTRPRADGGGGLGIAVVDGGGVRAVDCMLERNAEVGVGASGDFTVVELVDVIVRDTGSLPDGTHGRGLEVLGGASVRMEGGLLEGNGDGGVVAFDPGTVVDLVDVEIVDTAPSVTGFYGRGIAVEAGARVRARGCQLRQNTDIGVYANGAGSSVELLDVLVQNTRNAPGGSAGRGIVVQDGARVDATRCVLEGCGEIAVFAADPGSRVDLVQVDVVGTERWSGTAVAAGVVAQDLAEVVASEVRVEQTQGPGLFVSAGSIECHECELVGNGFAGIVLWSQGRVSLTDSLVQGTLADDNAGGGVGVYAADRFGAVSLDLERVVVEEHPLAAIWLEGDGVYRIRDSSLQGAVGVEIAVGEGVTVLGGDGVVAIGGVRAWDGDGGLLLEGNSLADAHRAGLLLDGSSVDLSGNSWSGNGVDAVWQVCDGVEAPALDGIPNVVTCPESTYPIVPLDFDIYLTEDVVVVD
jgi:hypothetical protein